MFKQIMLGVLIGLAVLPTLQALFERAYNKLIADEEEARKQPEFWD